MATKIEWARNADGTQGETWNPVIGCSHASPGCAHCYAERMAWRIVNMRMESGNIGPYADVIEWDTEYDHPGGRVVESSPLPEWNGKTVLVESALDKPLRRRVPTRYFVCSMGDLFHESVPDEWIDAVFGIMAHANRHTFIVLTKRAERMHAFLSEWHPQDCAPYPLLNAWIGVTAENQAAADERIPWLLRTPAAVRWVSVEPCIGPVDLRRWMPPFTDCDHYSDEVGCTRPENVYGANPGESRRGILSCKPEYCVFGWRGIDGVGCGGESGSGARRMDLAWVRSLRDQCQSAGVPMFYKQGPGPDGKLVKMPELDGRVWDEMPREAR
jgi:protein gp37